MARRSPGRSRAAEHGRGPVDSIVGTTLGTTVGTTLGTTGRTTAETAVARIPVAGKVRAVHPWASSVRRVQPADRRLPGMSAPPDRDVTIGDLTAESGEMSVVRQHAGPVMHAGRAVRPG
ncbi:hypothetical protein FrEUN1fDRAFT_3344 [Parafrankia sp. EUN1f]|nr:hypothetical protein FrEUN1fDRAFT_3344 [Parafrankia sp. EUN1f]